MQIFIGIFLTFGYKLLSNYVNTSSSPVYFSNAAKSPDQEKCYINRIFEINVIYYLCHVHLTDWYFIFRSIIHMCHIIIFDILGFT